MKTWIRLAVRNIWRNQRRTWITIAAIGFAVFFAVAMQSVQKGIFDHMEEGMVRSYTGFIQVHQAGYWDEPILDNAMPLDATDWKALAASQRGVDGFVPRLESFALASRGNVSKGSLVVGIDPAAEDGLSEISSKVIAGQYFGAQDTAVLIAEGLAEHLSLTVGDTLLLLSTGYRGASAAGAYPIGGIVRFPSPELNQQMVYLPLALAQDFYAAYDLATTVVADVTQPHRTSAITRDLSAALDEGAFEVMDYEALLPDLVQAREFKQSGTVVLLFILYAIIAFSIFGTILMMLKERQYEFGVLTAIGMKRWQLGTVIALEMFVLGVIGVGVGLAFAFAMAYGLQQYPIQIGGDMAVTYQEFGIEPLIMASVAPELFWQEARNIFIIVLLLSTYPLYRIQRLQPIAAMRG